jgi:ABC-type Fe3+ transport system permease subunit
VKSDSSFIIISRAASLFIWAVVVFLPLLVLFIYALNPAPAQTAEVNIYSSLARSFVLSAIIAGVSVLLGWVPGRLLGTCHAHKDLLLLLLLMPLVLPRYLLYYAWWLLLSPTTSLGAYLSGNIEVAKFVGLLRSTIVLIMWYWPLAALLLAQGWRNIDRRIWDSASLDAGEFGIFRNITLPLLKRSIFLAFGVCFVMSLSEFATFNLAGIKTIGTELAVLYELTGSQAVVTRASWPVAILALILAIVLGKSSRTWTLSTSATGIVEFKSQRWRWIALITLIGISLLIPAALLIGNVSEVKPYQQFFKLHLNELKWSLIIALAAAGLSFIIAYGAFSSLVARETGFVNRGGYRTTGGEFLFLFYL